MLTAADYGLNDPVYTIKETCEKTKLGRNSIYDLIKAGKLLLIKNGKSSLIATPDIVTLLNRRRAEALDRKVAGPV
jgi:Helix-turn-helix domain